VSNGEEQVDMDEHERPETSGPDALDPPPPGGWHDAIAALLDADETSVVVLGFDGLVRAANDSALHLLGVDSAASLQPGASAHGMLRSMLDQAPRQLVAGSYDGTWQGDVDHIDAAGVSRVFRATVAARRDGTLDGGGFVGLIAHDVTRARDEAARLRHQATHDPLTGLANRRRIMAILASAVDAQRSRPGHVAAIFIDVDRLKYVNDALGHAVGDQLLLSTARRLADSTRPEDRVARIGGDEFLVVCSDVPDVAAALELADRMQRALTGRMRIRELDLHFSVSVGIAVSDHEVLAMPAADAAATMIASADTAMYEAKAAGRRRCVLFTPEMRSAAQERSELAAELSRAIADKQLTVDCQPLFSAVTRKAVGAEALVRWHHPEHGPIEPAAFIHVAEESGAIGRLGEFVLERALIETRRWVEEGVVGEDFAVHVNVSQVQLASPSFVSLVHSTLRLNGLGSRRLVLEARETALLGQNPDVDRSIRALRRSGIQIAIDNFGTGANALSVLTDVGADLLKLDGSLALPSGSTDADTRIVRAIVLLAHAMGMRVVAERVTGADQLRRLRSAGCDLVQGNLLGAPGPAEELPTMTRY
jgi:diguanylate cyclase (GGDEF)-like protein